MDILVGMLDHIIDSHHRSYLVPISHRYNDRVIAVIQHAHVDLLALVRQQDASAAEQLA